MLSRNIRFKNFLNRPPKKRLFKIFNDLKNNYLSKNTRFLSSLSQGYKYNYKKKIINKYKKFQNFRVIGMGGSILGSKAIYQFLKHKIKKNFLLLILLFLNQAIH